MIINVKKLKESYAYNIGFMGFEKATEHTIREIFQILEELEDTKKE